MMKLNKRKLFANFLCWTIIITHVESTIVAGSWRYAKWKALKEKKAGANMREKIVLKMHKLRSESFAGWRQWGVKYPNCAAANNSYLSPIRINSKNVISVSNVRPIILHSKPASSNCFFFSIAQNIDDVEMEFVSILPAAHCKERITYISGAGGGPEDFRYFRRAILFFTKSVPELEHSLHQIDGKQFLMEIALEFSSKDGKEFTTIHILVEAFPTGQIPANVVISPLELAITDFKKAIVDSTLQSKSKVEKYNERFNNCSKMEKEYFDAHKQELERVSSQNNTDYLLNLRHIVKSLKGVTDEYILNITGTTNQLKKNYETAKKELAIRENEIKTLREKRKEVLENIEREVDTDTLQSDSDHVVNLAKIESEIQVVQDNVSESRAALRKLIKGMDKVEAKLMKVRNSILQLNIKIPGEEKTVDTQYESPNAIHEELLKSLPAIVSPAIYREACGEFLHVDRHPYGSSVISQPFQLSWLFPTEGGYYFYNGSNPIPPCEPRQRTIVLADTLKITTDQLAVFQSIPSPIALRKSSALSETMTNFDGLIADKMIPVLQNSTKRKVWYVKQNTIFVGQDSFHLEVKYYNSQPARGLDLISEESSANTCHGKLLYRSSIILITLLFCTRVK